MMHGDGVCYKLIFQSNPVTQDAGHVMSAIPCILTFTYNSPLTFGAPPQALVRPDLRQRLEQHRALLWPG